MKFDYGHPETHFEVWHHPSTAHLEVGLHFEGPALLNDDAQRFFRPRMLEVKRGLPRAELEPWDRGWARLYETCAATDLSHELLTPAAALLAAYIATLQPMLDAFWESRS